MTESQAVYNKLYVNSPQFESIMRENDANKSKTFALDLIPSNSVNKYNVKQILAKKKTSQDFRKKFEYSNPAKLYNELVQDSRGSLMTNISVQSKVSDFYIDKFDSNLDAIYKYSPEFYVKTFYTKIAGERTINADNFHAYEKYIYLLALIVYVNGNREKLRGELSNEAETIITWCQLRDDSSLAWILEGPNESYETPKNFIERYNSLIASAYSKETIIEQQKMSKMGMMYSSIEDFKYQSAKRPNVFDKTLDLARQYFIIIRDETHLLTELDETNNVIYDAKYIDLGEVNKNTTVAQYNTIRVDENVYIAPPSKIDFKSLQQLFTTFNSIAVQELSFAYEIYNVDLSRYATVYLVFPDVHTAEHTIIGEIPRGPLYIAGKFTNDRTRRRLIFKPNEEMTTFDGSQTTVKSFRFYITNTLENKNSIIGNLLTLDFIKPQIYNHLLKTSLNSAAIYDANTILNIRSDLIDFKLPTSLNDINVDLLNSFIDKLEFKPALLRELDLSELYDSYKQLQRQVAQNIDTSIYNSAESLITSNGGGAYVQLRVIDTQFKRLMEITRRLNSLFYHRKLVRSSIDAQALYRTALQYSEHVNYQNVIRDIATVADFESARAFFHKLCLYSVNELANSRDEYLDLFEKLISLIVRSLVYLPIPIEIQIDVFKGGRIDGLKFRVHENLQACASPNSRNQITNLEVSAITRDPINHRLTYMPSVDETIRNRSPLVHSLTFVPDNEGIQDYDFISDEENDIVTMRLFDEAKLEDSNSNPIVTVCYSQSQKAIQRLSSNILNVNEIHPIRLFNTGYRLKRAVSKDEDGRVYLTGGYENVDLEDVNAGDFVFMNLTEYTSQIPVISYKNSIESLDIIKYIPIELIDVPYLNFNLLRYARDSFEFTIDSNRNLSLITDSNRAQIEAGLYNAQIEFDDESIGLLAYNHKFEVSSDTFKLIFDLDENLKVAKIEFFYFIVNVVVFNTSFVIDLLKYSCASNGNEIAAHIKSFEFNENSLGPLFINDNRYRAYRTNENMLQRYWNSESLDASMLINRIPVEGSVINQITKIITANERTIIYTYETGAHGEITKQFYKLFSITPNVFILDNTIAASLASDKSIADKHVFVRSTIESKFSTEFTTPQVIVSKTRLTLNSENTNSLLSEIQLDVYTKSNLIYRIDLIAVNKTLRIDGQFESNEYYSFNMNLFNNLLHGQGSLTLNFENEDGVAIKGASVFISEDTLLEFYRESSTLSNDNVITIAHSHVFRNINEQTTKLTTDTLLHSLELDFNYNFNRIMPVFKYYQNNIDSKLFTNDGNIEMTINKTTDFASNRRARIQKYKLLNNDNKSDMNLAETIPYENRYVVEDINNKLIVTEVKNEIANDSNAIVAESGSLTFNNNDLLYLSLNMK